MDLSPRAVIAGRYRVDTKVGAGGMGEVWLGEHIAVGVRVAVKTLLPAAAMNHEVVARFKREAYILGKIRSDHVARVVDFVADDVYGLVLVMEFVDGDPLSRLLQERTLTVEEGIDLAFGLTLALKDLHGANIIHRDLKPGNVMMQKLPDGHRRAVVVDFGVSRLMSDKDTDEDEELTGITRADMAVGTIEYMAPEQILNSRNVAPGSDIYAVGAMLYRACAGRHVFGNVQSDTELAQKKLTTDAPPIPLERTDALTRGFAAVVARMVKRRPSERYKTADDVYKDLLPLRGLAKEAEADTATLNVKAAKTALESAPEAAPAPPAAPAVAPTSAPTSGVAASSPSSPANAVSSAHSSSPSSPSGPSNASSASSASSGSNLRDSVSGSGAVAAPTPASSSRGVPIFVTLALVAAALAGGLFLGPKLLEGKMGGAPTPAVSAVSATPVVSAVSVSATAAPLPSSAPPPSAAIATDPLDAGAVDSGTHDGGPRDAGADGRRTYPRYDGGAYPVIHPVSPGLL